MSESTVRTGAGELLAPAPARSPSRRRRLRLVAGALVAAAALPMLVSGIHARVGAWGRGYDVGSVPEGAVAMVFGAKADPGRPSAFLAARLDLAARLYEDGSVRAILVTGDGLPRSNDEPAIMKEYLVARGIPADKIVEDPAGFDTYDSCVRARDVYGAEALTLVTQDYHVNRAVTTCRAVGVDAVAVGDETMRGRFPLNWIKGWLREWPAAVKMEWDLLTARQPQRDAPTTELADAAAG